MEAVAHAVPMPVEAAFQPVGQWNLVTSVVNIEADLPYEIADGLVIEKPSGELRDEFKREAEHSLGATALDLLSRFEYDWRPDGENLGRTVAHKLEEADWRYYVLTTNDSGVDAIQLHRASQLTDVPLDLVSLSIMKQGLGRSIRPGALLWRSFGGPRIARVVKQHDLDDLKAVYQEQVATLGPELTSAAHPQIVRAHDLLDQLSVLPSSSDFQILGLFAIVEMLVAHNPKLEDRGDSISHQICTKLPLLFNRFVRPLDISTFFGPAQAKKVWNQLYAYRSAIAHGGSADFSSGPMQILKSRDVALHFLSAVVRRLIRHAYKEPKLLRDLCEV